MKELDFIAYVPDLNEPFSYDLCRDMTGCFDGYDPYNHIGRHVISEVLGT